LKCDKVINKMLSDFVLFNFIKHSTFCPQNAFVVYGSQNKWTISLHSISEFFFISEVECVHCAEPTEYLNII
jgi:hypothetical protein